MSEETKDVRILQWNDKYKCYGGANIPLGKLNSNELYWGNRKKLIAVNNDGDMSFIQYKSEDDDTYDQTIYDLHNQGMSYFDILEFIRL